MVLQDPERKKAHREGAAGGRQVDSVWGFQGGGATEQLFWTLQAPCLVSPGLSSLRLSAPISSRLRDIHISVFPFSSRPPLSLRPLLSALTCVLGPVAWARVCGWQWHSKGAENRPHPQNRQQGEVGLRHLGAWLADHKSWKCLTRLLLQGLEDWTLQGPSVAETSCHLPLEAISRQAQAGETPLLALSSPSLHCGACPGPWEGGQHPIFLRGASASPEALPAAPKPGPKRAPPPGGRVQAAVPDDTGGYGRVGWGKP